MKHLNLYNLLYIDIETVSEKATFSEVDSEMQDYFAQKTSYQRKDEFTPEEFYDRAGIWAEFGKIVCISIAYMAKLNGENQLRFRSFYGHNEEVLLEEFADVLSNFPSFFFCGHNIKEFDIPFICRRMLIHNITLPGQLDLAGKKPWEIKHIDTLEQWKFGDYKHYTSLKLLAKLFGIPSPKDDIDGSEVGRVYWKEDNLKRIAIYCEKDVATTAQLLLKWKGKPLLDSDQIIYSDFE